MDIRTLVAVVLSIVVIDLNAASPQLDGLLPGGSQYAVFAQSLNGEGEPLFEHNSDLLLPPASTQKIVTALAAKLSLGDDYRFVTSLERVGEDLVFRFSGDPTLLHQHLREMLAQYKKAHGKKPLRHIWLDGSAFGGYERGQGWPWDGMGSCYSAPSAAITLDGNCIQAVITSKGEPGSLTEVIWSKHQPVKITTVAKIVSSKEWRSLHCDLGLFYSRQNEYQLNGCMVHSQRPLGLKLAVQNPALFTKDIIKTQADELGLKYSGEIKITDERQQDGIVIAQHRSAPLPELLDNMLKHSNNLIADTLFKTIARKHYNQPGSYIGGERAVKEILKEKAGLDLSKAILADGSGLSRNDRMSVRHLAALVRYISQNDGDLHLMSTFPVSGTSGTLKYRASVSGNLKGKLQAKTGTLYGTKNLAGVLQTAKGNRLVVAQIVTSYFRGGRGGKSALSKFERELFGSLYRGY